MSAAGFASPPAAGPAVDNWDDEPTPERIRARRVVARLVASPIREQASPRRWRWIVKMIKKIDTKEVDMPLVEMLEEQLGILEPRLTFPQRTCFSLTNAKRGLFPKGDELLHGPIESRALPKPHVLPPSPPVACLPACLPACALSLASRAERSPASKRKSNAGIVLSDAAF